MSHTKTYRINQKTSCSIPRNYVLVLKTLPVESESSIISHPTLLTAVFPELQIFLQHLTFFGLASF